MRIVYTEQAVALEDPIKIRIYEPVRYAEGGLHSHAEMVRQAGRFGDDVLLHVTPEEFQQLHEAWGDPTRNPVTGLPEYGLLSKIGKGLKHLGNSVGSVAKKVIASPIVQKLGPIAASVFLPGVGGIIASAALKGVNAKLQGGKMSDVLKSAASGALMGGATHLIPGLGGDSGGGPLSKMAGFLPSNRGNDFSAPGSGGGANGALTPEDYVQGGSGGGDGSAGPMSKFLDFFKNDQGNPAWGKIAGASLGALALMKGISDQPSGHLGPQVGPSAANQQHLQPKPLNRQVVGLPNTQDYYNYGQTGGEHNFFQPVQEARGGMPMHRPAGHYIKGPGTGRSDEIDAKLSNDEYVMDAETVSLLGDGSPEEGARRLDQLRANLRKHKGAQLSKGKFSANAKPPEDYLPKGTMAKGGVFHPGEGMEAVRARRAARGVLTPPTVNAPLQNKQRLIDMLEGKKLSSPDVSDSDLADISKWLDTIRNMPPPPVEKSKGGKLPPVGPDLRALTGGVTKTPEMRAAELAAVQRFRDAIKSQQLTQKPAMPTQQQELLKFKKGGAITALSNFADDLEEELNLEHGDRVKEIKAQMDALHPGLGDFYESNMLRTGTE